MAPGVLFGVCVVRALLSEIGWLEIAHESHLNSRIWDTKTYKVSLTLFNEQNPPV